MKFQSQRTMHVIRDGDEAASTRRPPDNTGEYGRTGSHLVLTTSPFRSTRSFRRGRSWVSADLHTMTKKLGHVWHCLVGFAWVRAYARGLGAASTGAPPGRRRLRGHPPPPSFSPAALAQNSRTFNAACALFTENSGWRVSITKPRSAEKGFIMFVLRFATSYVDDHCANKGA